MRNAIDQIKEKRKKKAKKGVTISRFLAEIVEPELDKIEAKLEAKQ